ncbi:hypothetical protein ACHAXT_009273 [Thalassiosira profunda]
MTSTTSLADKALGALGDAFRGDPNNPHGRQLLMATGVVPLMVSAAWYYSRTTVEVADGEQSLWIQMWSSQQTGALKRVRNFQLQPPGRSSGGRRRRGGLLQQPEQKGTGDDDKEEGGRFAPPKLSFEPASGCRMWTWHGWWPVSICANSGARGMMNHDPYGRTMPQGARGYTLTVWLAPFGTSVAKQILHQGRSLYLAKRSRKTEIWINQDNYGGGGFQVVTRPSRPLSSVIIDASTKEDVRADAIRFLESELWYISKGIPYRRGFLLHGPPGCGKTSLVTALAGDLRLPIIVIQLNSKSMDDSALMSALSEAPRDSIVLIEDTDCALPRGAGNNETQAAMMMRGRMPVTLSGLLNAIDGVGAQEGRLLFMTTNHPDRLDEALIRPGRVDVQFHLDKATRPAAGELFDQFFAEGAGFSEKTLQQARSAFLSKVDDGMHSFATLQGVLMAARDDPSLVEEGMQSLLNSTDVGDPAKQSAYDVMVSFKRAEKDALEKEKEAEDSQRTAGSPVVKRLVGSPLDALHLTEKRQIIFQQFSTFAVPEDLLSTSGTLYYEIEVLQAHGTPQFGFALKDGIKETQELSTDGVGDNATSWAVDGSRLAANIDAGMIAVAINGVWEKDGDAELGVVFQDERIKEGVFPCFSASSYKLRYCFKETDFEHGLPPESLWAE